VPRLSHAQRRLGGATVPALGQGTWAMGDDPAHRREELAALRVGIELGMTLIDTAEMYGDGRSESLVGEAIAGRCAEVFLVSKVLPQNASRAGVARACEASLRRLKTDRLDLYLLHWPGPHPLAETVRGFEDLIAAGKIRAWGVSNLDLDEMRKLVSLRGGKACATNQVLYNLSRRGIERDLLPWCHEHGMPIMAYSPVEQGRILGRKVLGDIARDLDATPAQVALAWVLRQQAVVAIPKAARVAHVRENRKALDLELDAQALAALDRAFPAPPGPVPLEVI
jgi:diketogulonate reductase-like aldo/keto reductase